MFVFQTMAADKASRPKVQQIVVSPNFSVEKAFPNLAFSGKTASSANGALTAEQLCRVFKIERIGENGISHEIGPQELALLREKEMNFGTALNAGEYLKLSGSIGIFFSKSANFGFCMTEKSRSSSTGKSALDYGLTFAKVTSNNQMASAEVATDPYGNGTIGYYETGFSQVNAKENLVLAPNPISTVLLPLIGPYQVGATTGVTFLADLQNTSISSIAALVAAGSHVSINAPIPGGPGYTFEFNSHGFGANEPEFVSPNILRGTLITRENGVITSSRDALFRLVDDLPNNQVVLNLAMQIGPPTADAAFLKVYKMYLENLPDPSSSPTAGNEIQSIIQAEIASIGLPPINCWMSGFAYDADKTDNHKMALHYVAYVDQNGQIIEAAPIWYTGQLSTDTQLLEGTPIGHFGNEAQEYGTFDNGGAGPVANEKRNLSMAGRRDFVNNLPISNTIDASDLVTSSGSLPGLGTKFALSQNQPNPVFGGGTTTIPFNLVQSGRVNLSIFDMSGRKIAELVNGNIEAGRHEVKYETSALSKGIYLVKFEQGALVDTKKMAVQ